MIHRIHNNNYALDEQRVSAAARISLDMKGIYEMYHLVEEIKRRLVPFKLDSVDGVARVNLSTRHKNIILKVCIAGAFYPNYFLRASCISKEERERQIFHDLNGRDPTNTVFYRGIGMEEMGILYENQVKNFLQRKNVIKSKDDVVVTFDEGCQKMFVTFVDKQDLVDNNNQYRDSLPGNIKTQIYKSIKLTREREHLRLNTFEKTETYKYAEKVGIGRFEKGLFVHANVKPKPYAVQLCCLPGLYDKEVLGCITNVRTPNKFWIKPMQKINDTVMKAIQVALTEVPLYPVHDFDEIVGRKVAVELDEDCIYRARVVSTVMEGNGVKFKVFLIDEGTEHTVVASQLKSIANIRIDERKLGFAKGSGIPLVDIPPRVFEATLAEIRPSYLASSSGKWTLEAISEFKDLTKDHDYGLIEIYSLWNGVASVIIHGKRKQTINQELVERQLAQSCEESYPSKYDHTLRYKAQNFGEKKPGNATAYQEVLEYLKQFDHEPIKPPNERLCTKSVVLRGPVSPLETTIHATIRSGFTKALSIERFSVNSVLLDTDPQDPTDRLVVAASCGSNPAQNGLILRNTTVMPNIHGFGPLMAMLFAPKVEMHPDETESRFNSILCGLGYHETTKKGYFEEHDLIMTLDCFLDHKDLLLVK